MTMYRIFKVFTCEDCSHHYSFQKQVRKKFDNVLVCHLSDVVRNFKQNDVDYTIPEWCELPIGDD